MIAEHLHNLLLKSLDAELSPEESLKLESALAESEELRTLKEEYLQQKALISNQEFRLRPFLATRVMAGLEKLQETKEWIPGLSFAFKRLALPVFALILLVLTTAIVVEQQITVDTFLGVSVLSIDELMNDFIVSN